MAANGPDPGGTGAGYDVEVSHYVVPAAIAALFVAVIAGMLLVLGGGGGPQPSASDAASRTLPPIYTVHAGDTYETIAKRTGLRVDDLETFNPYVNPQTIVPGQRLKLRLHVPKPTPRPKGPRFATVRSGDTFDSIARRTHHDVSALLRRNPKLDPTSLRPGTRIRLRR